jgi:ABC-type multidrug transport system fused ATPase/permease subunit
LNIRSGEKIAILGTSGSGKTTAMKLLVGMYPISSGSITIDNTDIQEIDLRYLRDQTNYVNQRTMLFNDTILSNIRYGHANLTDERILSVLRNYQLDVVFSKLNDGVHTIAGVHGGNLSLGMQKVTMLMRGLFRTAKIVVLDEPLAGLDSQTRGKVMRLIKDVCKDKTLIVITHDREIIPYMDRVENINELNQKSMAKRQEEPPAM